MQLRKENMFDKSGQWIHLETYDDFDNGLSDLIELWSSETATKAVKDAAFAHFKEDLEAASLQWIDNKSKSKKYAAIAQELAEFEEVLSEGAGAAAPQAASPAPAAPVAPKAPAKARKKV
jgi:hypothetical protein